jgi:hypothetical protein
MMKTNVMTVDASLFSAMKNSTFALLTDYFAFVQLSSDIYTVTQQNLASSSPPCYLAGYSRLYQIFWRDRLDDALRNNHLKIMLPPSQT